MPISSSEAAGSTPVVAFVGRSGSGKTTLLERLLPGLHARGVRVAVVKHAVRHAVASDVPGTDTHRFWEVGAAQVALVAQDRLVWTRRYEQDPGYGAALALVEDVDLVLLEGFKQSPFPKVEIVRRACDPELLPGLENVIAVVTDVPDLVLANDVALFGLGEPEAIAEFLVQRLAAWERR